MLNKRQLTESLVSQSDLWTVDSAMKDWWQNSSGGYRLTAVGLEAFEQCKIEHWKFDLARLVISPSFLLTLDRKLTGPYYIQVGKNPKLYFFNSKEATVYALYGDLNKFISTISYWPDARSPA